mmetsp:Transcript_20115/g.19070  ORF Transcript_20115/g.19070 Transcript_20115/m.19070 type:complete len:91 (+) Transcript_20115:341-613(+)
MGQKYDYKSDSWMVGCILYELCSLKRPFEGDSWNIVINKIIYSNYNPLGKEYFPIFNQILEMTLQKNAGIRASVEEILSLKQIKERLTIL